MPRLCQITVCEIQIVDTETLHFGFESAGKQIFGPYVVKYTVNGHSQRDICYMLTERQMCWKVLTELHWGAEGERGEGGHIISSC